MPEDSFRLVIAGPSGSGKTNTLLHMIYNLLFFDEILLFAKNLHQDKYQFLLQDFAERVDPEVGYKVIETPPEIVPLKALDHESQKVVIFDDYVCEKKTKRNCQLFYKRKASQLLSHLSFLKFFQSAKKHQGYSFTFLHFSISPQGKQKNF